MSEDKKNVAAYMFERGECDLPKERQEDYIKEFEDNGLKKIELKLVMERLLGKAEILRDISAQYEKELSSKDNKDLSAQDAVALMGKVLTKKLKVVERAMTAHIGELNDLESMETHLCEKLGMRKVKLR